MRCIHHIPRPILYLPRRAILIRHPLHQPRLTRLPTPNHPIPALHKRQIKILIEIHFIPLLVFCKVITLQRDRPVLFIGPSPDTFLLPRAFARGRAVWPPDGQTGGVEQDGTGSTGGEGECADPVGYGCGVARAGGEGLQGGREGAEVQVGVVVLSVSYF